MNFVDAIFCDDIRQEINNKLSLMGLYSDRMTLNTMVQPGTPWPLPVNLSALLRFSIEKEEKRPNYFEFEYFLNEKKIIQISGELNTNIDDTKFQLIINGIGIPLEPGKLIFSIKLYDQEKTLVLEKKETALNILQN